MLMDSIAYNHHQCTLCLVIIQYYTKGVVCFHSLTLCFVFSGRQGRQPTENHPRTEMISNLDSINAWIACSSYFHLVYFFSPPIIHRIFSFLYVRLLGLNNNVKEVLLLIYRSAVLFFFSNCRDCYVLFLGSCLIIIAISLQFRLTCVGRPTTVILDFFFPIYLFVLRLTTIYQPACSCSRNTAKLTKPHFFHFFLLVFHLTKWRK